MIGKDIRSVRQLAKECGTSLRSAIVSFNQHGTAYCKVMWFEKYKPTGEECLFIFNNQYGYGRFRLGTVLSVPELDKHREELSTHYGRLFAVSKSEYDLNEVGWIITGIKLLPESFEDDYHKFLKENQKAINPLIHKYGFSPDDEVIKRIYCLTENSKNFFVWAINAFYHCRITLNAIKRILWWNENYKQLVKKLSKGTITAYTTARDIYKLFDEMIELRQEKRINDSINMFNTAQKKLLREMELTEDDKKVFSSFYRLSESKKTNFVKKMSTITDTKEIMRQMRHITSTHFSWNKDSFMDYVDNVEGINYEKIYEKDNVVLVKVKDFETVKQLAKTTNWCISKNKSYWNNYVENVRNAEQFIVFDFNQKEDALTSIVGFTCRYNKGITNAHDFINNNMLDNGGITRHSLLNSYISHLTNESGIYSFLENHGIDINMVAKYEKPFYVWNKESMYKYLYECVDKENVRILVDREDQVAISVTDENIRYFLGDSYIDNVPSDYYPLQHIIFMSFNMNQYDPNRILFAIIKNGREGNEDYVIDFKNEHCIDSPITFETKLSQFGLPYDTIRRVDDKYVRLRDAIQSFNTPEIMKGIKNKDLFNEVLYDYVGEENMTRFITDSILSYASFDYLDIFYNNGYKIGDFMNFRRVINLANSLLNNYVVLFNNRTCPLPSQKDIDAFFYRGTTSIADATRTCRFLAIDKILANECKELGLNEMMFKNLMGTIVSSGAKGGAVDHFVEFMLDNVDISRRSDCLNLIIAFSVTRGGAKLKEKIEALASKSRYIQEKLAEFCDKTVKSEDKDPEALVNTYNDEEGYEAEPAFEDEMEEAPEFEDEFAEAIV